MRGGRLLRAGPYAAAAVVTILLLVTTLVARTGADASDFLGGRQLRLMAPAAPGGGWDQTAREMQAALRDVAGRTEVYNVAGAGGTIGLSQFVRHDGDPAELMVIGLVMLGAIESDDAPVGLDRTTPLARLTTDWEIIVVPANSRVRTVADLTSALRANPAAVSISGGSAGGVEQILAGLVAEAAGADPARIGYVAHSGGGEALATLLSGRATAGIAGVSELLPQIKAGTVRPLAVSSGARLPALPDVPTLRESGVDVELANWRGVVAPPGISDADEAALEELITRMATGPAWRETLETRGWGDALLTGPEFERYLADEQRRVADILTRMGLT